MAASNSVLARMAVIISANTAEFNRALKDTQNNLGRFTGMISKSLAVLGVGLGAKQILDAGIAVSKLAGQAEGVAAAFSRLPNSVALMKDLKEATGNTVSELELMKRAVMASNFDIELAALPKLLEFATLRAQQTGQSVDYLVDSIVTGIGRKSKLILDNLGISAVALSQKLGGVSTEAATVGQVAKAVGEIAADSLKNMAGFSDNAATKMDRLAASWDNVGVSIGRLINNTKVTSWMESLVKLVDQINEALEKNATSRGLKEFVDQFNRLEANRKNLPLDRRITASLASIQMQKEIAEWADRLGVKLVKITDPATDVIRILFDPRSTPNWIKGTNTGLEKLIITLDYLQKKQNEVNETFETTDVQNSTRLRLLAFEDAALEKRIEKLERIKKIINEELVMKKPGEKSQKALIGKSDLIDMEAVDNFLYQMRRMLAEALKTTEGIKQSFIDIGPGISNVIAGIAAAAGEAAAGTAKFGKEVLKVVGGFMQQFGAALIATGVGEIAFKSFSGPGMIIAGAALVAAGTVLHATVNKRPDLSSSNRSASSSSSRSEFQRTGTSMQNSAPELVTVIKGQDLWVMLLNYQRGNTFTRAVG